MSITLRPLRAEDHPALWALWLQCPGMGLNDRDDSPEGLARYLQRNPTTSFAAVEEGRIIGCIMAGHDGRRGLIHHTAVHPAHRGRGVGRMLVEAALQALQQEGVSKAALLVFRRNEGGNAFWEHMGFTLREDIAYRNITLAEMTRIDT